MEHHPWESSFNVLPMVGERVDQRVPLVIMTSPVTQWALAGLFHQLQVHGGGYRLYQSVRPYIFGFDETVMKDCPDAAVQDFISLGRFADYPMAKWSDSFIVALNHLVDRGIDAFWFMLDDYWPIRGIDLTGITLLHRALLYDPQMHDEKIMKIDLTFDRLLSGNVTDGGHVGHLDLIIPDPGSQYHMSLWGGLLHTKLLLDMMKPGRTAQQVELDGTPDLREKGYGVIGTRQGPLMHTNVCHAGGVFNFPGPAVSEQDMWELREWGYTNGK